MKQGSDRFVLGFDVLSNRSGGPVSVDDVRLVSAVHVRLLGARLTALPSKGPSTAMGVVAGPPLRPYDAVQRPLWRRSSVARGGAVGPSAGGTDQNLLVEVASDSPSTTDKTGVEVDYHQGTHHYTWRSVVTYVLAATSCNPSTS
jgi:hypothetical protein